MSELSELEDEGCCSILSFFNSSLRLNLEALSGDDCLYGVGDLGLRSRLGSLVLLRSILGSLGGSSGVGLLSSTERSLNMGGGEVVDLRDCSGVGAVVWDRLCRLKKNSLFSNVSSGLEEELELFSRGTSIFTVDLSSVKV